MNDSPAFRIFAAIALVTLSCVFFTSLQGCGNGNSADTAQVGSQAGNLRTQGLGHSVGLLHEAQVVCADGNPCPENVGMVVAAFEDGVHRCSGALIGPDLVVTSSSCIPTDLSNCGERLRFLLPALGSIPAQEGTCAEVLSTDPAASYAFVRLFAPVQGRHSLKLNVSGLQDGQSFSVPVVNPTSDTKPFGEIRVLSCQAEQRTVILPQFAGDSSPVAALGGCSVSATGYGAPVLDDQGAMRALVQSGTSPKDIQDVELTFGPMLPNTQVEDFAFAANLACVQIPGTPDRQLSPSCVSDSKIVVPSDTVKRVVTPLVLAAAQAALPAKIAKWQTTQRLSWAFAPLSVSSSQQAKLLPSCFAGTAEWIGTYRRWYNKGGYGTDAEMDFTMPRLRVDFDLSAALQSVFLITESGSDSVRLHFNPKDLAQSGQSSMTLTSSTTGAVIAGPLVLKNCSR